MTTTDGTTWTWERLYAEFAGPISGYASSKGVTTPDDLAQDVLRVAVERLADFDGDDANLRSWLFTIAHHRVADHHRRAHRRPETLVAEHGPLAATSVAPEEGAVGRAEVSEIYSAFAVVSERERRVLQMRIIDETSPSDVGDVMGLSSGNVRVIQARALRKIRRHLEQVNGVSMGVPGTMAGVSSVARFVRDLRTAPPVDAAVAEWIERANTVAGPSAAASPVAASGAAASGAGAASGAASGAAPAAATVTSASSLPTVGSGLAVLTAGKLAGAGFVAAAVFVGLGAADLVAGAEVAAPASPIEAGGLGVGDLGTFEPGTALDGEPTSASDGASATDPSATEDVVGSVVDLAESAASGVDGFGLREDLSVEGLVDDVLAPLPATELTATVDGLVDDLAEAIELPLGLDPLVDGLLDEAELTPVTEDVLGLVGDVGGEADALVDSVVGGAGEVIEPDLLEGLLPGSGDSTPSRFGGGWPWGSED